MRSIGEDDSVSTPDVSFIETPAAVVSLERLRIIPFGAKSASGITKKHRNRTSIC
jgi:hypothetical protein